MNRYVIKMGTGSSTPLPLQGAKRKVAVGERTATEREEKRGKKTTGRKMVSKRMSEEENGGNRIALTWGDAGENHVGMELVGEMRERGTGFTFEDLKSIAAVGAKAGLRAEVHSFGCNGTLSVEGEEPVDSNAGVLIIRSLVKGELLAKCAQELNALEWDSKYWDRRRQRVLNKRARTNLMFQHGVSQEPQYEKGKGRIVDLDTLEGVRVAENLISGLVKKGLEKGGETEWVPLVCEGNNYYDLGKTGIGFHGDSERTRVICLSVGAQDYPMRWQWFLKGKVIGPPIDVRLNSGDVYVMSEKAVGQDWKSRSIPTLRHAAGCDKYTKIQKKWL